MVGNTPPARSLGAVTINGSCWNSVQQFVQSQESEKVFVILCQEVKISGDKQVQAVQWCERHGWKTIFADCTFSDNGYPMSGAGILVRDGYNIGIQPADLPP